MADLRVIYAGIEFKNPIVISSIETSDSLERIKKSIDSGAGGVVIKTITDKPKMSELSRHSKYAILNDKGEIIKGKDHVISISENCIGCELCYSVCPSDAISFVMA